MKLSPIVQSTPRANTKAVKRPFSPYCQGEVSMCRMNLISLTVSGTASNTGDNRKPIGLDSTAAGWSKRIKVVRFFNVISWKQWAVCYTSPQSFLISLVDNFGDFYWILIGFNDELSSTIGVILCVIIGDADQFIGVCLIPLGPWSYILFRPFMSTHKAPGC